MESTETSERRRGPLLVAVAGAAAVAIGLVVTNGPGEAKNLATLDVVEPSVNARFADDDDFHPASPGQTLTAGDRLRTSPEGLAKLTYFDGSITRVGSSSSLTIDELARDGGRRIRTTLAEGRTWHRVRAATAASGSRFEVRHGSMRVTARGTGFAVSCLTSASCRVDVVDGSVRIETGRDGVTVRKGKSVEVASDGEIGSLMDLDADEWIVENKRLDGVIDDRAGTDGGGDATTTSVPADAGTAATPTRAAGDGGDGGGSTSTTRPRTTTTTSPPGTPATTTTRPPSTTATTTPGDQQDPEQPTTTRPSTTTTVDGDGNGY